MNELLPTAVGGVGMVLLGVAAYVAWKTTAHTEWKWFWIGAALWALAVAMKVALAFVLNEPVTSWFKRNLSYPSYIAATGLYLGVLSSACEIGLTIVAVATWPRLGRDAGRAIAIGVGAGAIEAFLLGAAVLVSVAIAVSSLPEAADFREKILIAQGRVGLFWLSLPVERAVALLCHSSSRGLVLLGFAHRRPWMVMGGLAIFTAVDGIASGAIVFSKRHADVSPWWIVLAIVPLALLSVFILRWSYHRWREKGQALMSAMTGGNGLA